MATMRLPPRANACARLAAIVVLPTPPLPPAIAIVRGVRRLGELAMCSLEDRNKDVHHVHDRAKQGRRCGEVPGSVTGVGGDLEGAVDLALRQHGREVDGCDRLRESPL